MLLDVSRVLGDEIIKHINVLHNVIFEGHQVVLLLKALEQSVLRMNVFQNALLSQCISPLQH